ncbi:hypothetical protein ACWGCC_03695 [Streptomyces nigrescens]
MDDLAPSGISDRSQELTDSLRSVADEETVGQYGLLLGTRR